MMLDIVVPVYNEKDNIKNLFEEIQKKIKTEKRIIVVYDKPEDNTVPVVNEIYRDYLFEITLEQNIYGKGALNAIKTGFVKSTAKAVLVVMADLSDNLEVVDSMLEKIENGHDIVCGSRYMKGGKQIGGPFLKKLFSRIAGVSLHFLIRIPTHDVTNSFKMYSRKVLDTITIQSTGGFELGMELTIKSYVCGYRVSELPSTWYDRTEGNSNFKMWEWMPRYLYWYFFAIKNTWFRKRGTK